jgi:predicted flap endonuclease-1-like 5' DNA nuclease
MKRLLRLLLLIAVIAAVVWATRERMLPKPAPPTAHPPPFRHPPESGASPPSTATTGSAAPAAQPEATAALVETDDLQRVKGIGPVYETKLHKAGITSFVQLVAADSAQIAEQLDVQVVTVVDWKTQASEFLT